MMPVPPPQMIASRRKQSQDIFRPEDRRRPSQDTSGRRSEDVGERSYLNRRPSESVSTTSDSTSTATAQSATAGMGMVIPNKSTIAEEDIEVPYGREVRDSTGTAVDERERINRRDRSRERESDTDFDGDDALSPRSPPSALGGLGGLSGLAARLQAAEGDDDDGGTGGRSDDYFDKISFGRASVASDRSASGRMPAGRTSVNGGDHERMKRDYEYKIATMQSRITGLERDLENAHLRSQESAGSDERIRVMEAELGEFRRVRAK